MRIAWLSPLPPARSGIASFSAELVPVLQREFEIDCFPEERAHDLVWQHRRAPYDLVVYHLGNAEFHDYMWAYLAAYPGLVVLHDPRLHHARARHLLSRRRFDDYRREFWFDHPDVPRDVVEYAIEGLSGPIYYLWPMLRVVMETARVVAVHNERVAEDLRASFPDAAIRSVALGKAPVGTGAHLGDVRRLLAIPSDGVVFAVFGTLTPEKRVAAILQAFAATLRAGADAWLLLVGDSTDDATSATIDELGVGHRVRQTGYVADAALPGYLAAADVCLCLRWPTALETSAAWLHCLAARRATVITDLAHLVDVPTVDPLRLDAMPDAARHPRTRPPVAVRIDLLQEASALPAAMDALARDRALREALADAGYEYWSAHHTIDEAAADYRRVIYEAAGRAAPDPANLPRHFTDDYSAFTDRIANQFGVSERLFPSRGRT